MNIQKEIEISNRRRKNWMMALWDGKLSAEDNAMLIEEEDKRMREINAQIQDEPSESTIPVEELQKMIKNLFANWYFLEPATQKQFIQSMFRKIVIDKKKDGWSIVELLPIYFSTSLIVNLWHIFST